MLGRFFRKDKSNISDNQKRLLCNLCIFVLQSTSLD